MKITILSFILSIGIFSFHRTDNPYSSGKLTEPQLHFVIENYQWTSEKLLIVNFRQPKSRCHYDHYADLKNSAKWWREFYADIDLQNVRNIFVYADHSKAKNSIDMHTHYADASDFFLNQIFSLDKTCYGVLVLNKSGHYRKKAGEYNQKDIEKLILELE